MAVIVRQTSKTEGGKTFERLRYAAEELYYIVYDSEMNMITESTEDFPLPENNVVDSLFSAFGAATYKEMVDEAKRLGVKR